MKIAIMQPYLFPHLGYFQLLNAVDKFVVLDDVHYIKKGWINRNNLLINGQKALFTVPLRNASQNRLINEIEVAEDARWLNKLLHSIQYSYQKAEFFAETMDMITNILGGGETLMSRLIVGSLQLFKQRLGLNAEIIESSRNYDDQELKGQLRILDICRKEGATHYINPSGGTDLYDKGVFAEQGLALSFLYTRPISYDQFGREFVPNLSIVDVLMFNGFEGTKRLLSEYELR